MVNSIARSTGVLRIIGIVASGAVLGGCGGGGGLGLSGGSIPTGGTITGKLVLPSGAPVTSATTTATVLDTSQPATVTSSIDTSGNFSVSGLPTSKNLKVQFDSGSGANAVTLRVIVPSTVVSSTGPVSVGQVDANTTVAAQAIEDEIANQIDTVAGVVSTQLANVSTNQAASGETPSQQSADIHDPKARHSSALRVMILTADQEIRAVKQTPTDANASTALDGVLAYVLATGGSVGNLSTTQRQELASLQKSGKQYTTAQVAAALNAAGITADSTSVAAAQQTQRTTLTGFASYQGIPALEALAIAACPSNAGGFGATSTQLSAFVDALVVM